MSTVKCKVHQNSISKVCIFEKCEQRLLCDECFTEHDQEHINEILGSEQVFSSSKKVILMDQIIQKGKESIEENSNILEQKKDKLCESVQQEFKKIEEKLIEILHKKKEDTLQLVNEYFKHSEELVENMQQILENIQTSWQENQNQKKKKMMKVEEKIQEHLEKYQNLMKNELQVINEKQQIFELLMEKQQQNLVNKGIIEPFSTRFQNEIDKLSFIKTQSLGKLQIDIRQIKNMELDKTFMGHEDWVTCISQINKNNMVATGSNDNIVKIFNLSTEQPILELRNHTQCINDMLYLGEDLLITACQDGHIRIFNTNNGEIFDFFLGHEGGVKCISKIGDVNTMLYATGGGDNCVCVRDAKQKKLLNKIEGVFENIPTAMAHNQEYNQLIVGDQKGKIYLFNIAGQSRNTLESHENTYIRESLYQQQCHEQIVKKIIVLDEDKKIFVSCSQDMSIKVWSIDDSYQFQMLQDYKEHSGSVNSLLNLNSNRVFMSGGWDTHVKVWDIKKKKSIFTKTVENNFVDSMGYLNDGKTIITGGSDHQIRVFKIPYNRDQYSTEIFIHENTQDIIDSQRKDADIANQAQCQCSIF